MRLLPTSVLIFCLLLAGQAQAQCWRTFDAGKAHAVAIASDGTLWLWGAHGTAMLGDETAVNREPMQKGSDTTWSQVSAGDYFTLAIKADGTLWAWGANHYGQLGTGNNYWSNSLQQVGTDTDWAQVSVGDYHTLALKTDGSLWAWGYNEYGQLGDSTTTLHYTPQKIGIDTTWRQIATGAYHSLGLKSNGTIWAWGRNLYGQLGLGFNSPLGITPVQVDSATNWQLIAAQKDNSGALKTDGTIWLWGNNFEAQLGNPNLPSVSYVPWTPGVITDCRRLDTGTHTAAIKNDGSLWLWGSNGYGQIGNGMHNTEQINVLQITEDNDWAEVATGSLFTVALKTDGSLWTWGSNHAGQLGIGGYLSSYSPTPITCPTSSTHTTLFPAETLEIAPNPAHSTLHVTARMPSTEGRFEIRDVLGKMTASGSFSGNYQAIDVAGFAPGTYVLTLFTPRGVVSRQWVKLPVK